jgi:iron(III) transport system substrate-binding protein
MKSRITAPLALLGVAALALTGCSAGGTASTDTAASGSSAAVDDLTGTITVYTSEPEDKQTAIVAAFNEQYPNVQVDVFRAATGDLTARIDAEQKSGGVKADLLWAADVPTFQGYADQGLLAEYTPADADQLQDGIVDPDGHFVGTRIIPTVIAYNTNAVENPPTSWKALTDSEYRGKITMPNPDVSGAAAYNAAVWLDDDGLGKPWLQDLAANEPVIAESNGPVAQSVAAGTQPIGIVVDYLVRDLAKAGSPIAVSYPEEGVPYIDEPVGIFESSDEKPAAQAFEDFLVSKAGQELAVAQNYLPVRGDVGTPSGAPALDDIATFQPDQATITEQKADAVKTFNSLFQ